MACYHPLTGYITGGLTASGKREIVFKIPCRDSPQIKLPCGQCIGCRLEYSRQWAIRCVHEAFIYTNNCFITLTYSPEYLPTDGTLILRDFQNFMKSLRKKYVPINPHFKCTLAHIAHTEKHQIRFYHCGEYGEVCFYCKKPKPNKHPSHRRCSCETYTPSIGRPHYHACLFNFDFKDKVLFSQQRGNNLYTSHSLDKLWKKGHCLIGEVTFESAAYVARYIIKKQNGINADSHYLVVDNTTGEITADRKPEYTTMSRRPGIGRAWLDKFQGDIYPDDFVILNGKKMRPPKFYDTQLELSDPSLFIEIKRKRKKSTAAHACNNTPDRLQIRETIQKYRLNMLERNLEETL